MKKEPDNAQLLFSTNTYSGLYIAKQYYEDKHYLWFAPLFHDPQQPKTSDPLCRCQMLLSTVATNDTHDEFLAKIRQGMEVGVQTKLKASVITEEESLEIRAIIDNSRKETGIREWCMPVVVVTTWSKVKQYRVELESNKKASSSSMELLCENVPRSVFDVIILEDIMNQYNPFKRGGV